MSNTISVNYMSSMTNRYMNMVSRKASEQTSTGTMSDAIAKALAGRTSDVERAASTATVSKEDMTMEEYKQYISDQISSFPLHPSQAGELYSINISDAGFEAMKNDPEYEKWVLDDLKTAFAMPVPSWYQAMGGPSTYCICNYGASKEEYSGQMFSIGGSKEKNIFDTHAKDSFWTNRRDKQKQIRTVLDKKAKVRKRQEKNQAENAVKQRLQHQQIMQEFLSSRFFSAQQSVQGGATVGATSYSSAVASYEASVVTMDM